MRPRPWLTLAALAAAAPAMGMQAEPPLPEFSVVLKPGGAPDALDHVEARSVLSGVEAGPGEPFLAVPVRFANLRAEPYDADDVRAEDAVGPLPLTMTEDLADPATGVQWRRFTASRPTRGPIRLSYRAAITPTAAPRTLGPSYDLRGVGGGFTGGGASFMILPADQARRYRLSLDWDLGALPDGAVGVSTLGSGRAVAEGPASRFMSVFLLGGMAQRYPANAGALPFNGYWIGEPNFDAPGVMAWTSRSYDVLRAFFRASDQAPYFLFARPNPNPTIGGAATENGFMLEYGSNARDEDALRFMFTHEMIHHFTAALDGPPMTTSWWHEGLAEYYKIRLPLRAGLIDFPTYATTLAGLVDGYYRNPGLNLPNDQVAARFWADRSVQNLPYARGFLYFAGVDAQVRAASAGRRSLDDLVLAMLESRRAGTGYDEARWRAIIAAELGDAGVAQFEAMMRGETLAAPEDAFGPCFGRRAMTYPRIVLGFADPALQSEPTVRNLDPDSAAARAGLREGDRIVRLDGWSRDRAAQNAGGEVVAEVERDGATVPIRFSSRAGDVSGFVWERVAGVPDAQCAR